MPKCVACGKEASPTTYIDGLPYCLECSRTIDSIIDEAISTCLEEYFATGKMPRVDELLPSDDFFQKLKIRKERVKRIILMQVASAIGRRG